MHWISLIIIKIHFNQDKKNQAEFNNFQHCLIKVNMPYFVTLCGSAIMNQLEKLEAAKAA